jgi:Domain of unknown function (DUF4956)
MPEWLQELVRTDVEVHLDQLLYRLAAAFVLGWLVAAVYQLTHRGEQGLSPGFVSTLVMLTVLIALVTQVIGSNQARAFSLVGALAIIRFRTVVEDTRDTAFVIFAVAVGMAAGAGAVVMGFAGAAVGALAAFLVQPRGPAAPPAEDEWVLTLRLGIGQDQQAAAEAVLTKSLASWQAVAVTTARQGAALEVTYRLRLRPGVQPTALVGDLNRVEGIQGVELRKR